MPDIDNTNNQPEPVSIVSPSTSSSIKGIGFLELIFTLLTKPIYAGQIINDLYNINSQSVYRYALIVLILSICTQGILKDSVIHAGFTLVTWFFNILAIYLIASLFVSKNKFSRLLTYAAFAQLPFLFSGISTLWTTSAFHITTFSILINLWSLCLWVWALYYGFNLKFIQACLLTVLCTIWPILCIGLLIIYLITLIF